MPDDLVARARELADDAPILVEYSGVLRTLAARVEALVGLLKECEWAGWQDLRGWCPACRRHCTDGHAPDYRLDAALGQGEGVGGG
jgi:hypothetical protein